MLGHSSRCSFQALSGRLTGCCPGFWFVPTVQPFVQVSYVGYLRPDASVPSGRGCFVAQFGRPSLFSIANAVCLRLRLSRFAASWSF